MDSSLACPHCDDKTAHSSDPGVLPKDGDIVREWPAPPGGRSFRVVWRKYDYEHWSPCEDTHCECRGHGHTKLIRDFIHRIEEYAP